MVTQEQIMMQVRKLDDRVSIDDRVSVIDIEGEVTAAAEFVLMNAYNQATADGADTIILNFSRLKYMNSTGIGLLVTFLIRVQRARQHVYACHLNEHYRQIFELTRLNEAIAVYDDEAEIVKAIKSSKYPRSEE